MVKSGVTSHVAEKTANRIATLDRAVPLTPGQIGIHADTFMNAYLDNDLPPSIGRVMAPLVFDLRTITRIYDAIVAWTCKKK